MSKNLKASRPVLSFRTDQATVTTFKATCIEVGVDPNKALEKLLKYFMTPYNIDSAKVIITHNEDQ